MYYEINIAKKNKDGYYHHYFATAKRSITTKERLKVILSDLINKYPEPDYMISVIYNPEEFFGLRVGDILNDLK